MLAGGRQLREKRADFFDGRAGPLRHIEHTAKCLIERSTLARDDADARGEVVVGVGGRGHVARQAANQRAAERHAGHVAQRR